MSNEDSTLNKREQQLDAIIAAYYRAIEAGDCVDQKDFIAQHPEVQRELKEFFADLGMLEAASPQNQQHPSLAPTMTIGTGHRKNLAAGEVVRYFGEYEILEELGAGGMGVVYKARQITLNRIVALKMIRSGELANAQDVQRFEAEAKAAAKLSHPGIVSVHEVGIYKGQHFYTMDYVAGGNLSQLHRSEPVASTRAAKLVRRLALSMHYAHQQGIIHRDLKPANILLTAKGAPRITDFGLAKRFRADDESHAPTMTESGQILGTAGYMSPEQATGKSRLVGPPSDVYSLGAVLYALLTTRAPFVGETPSHTILQLLKSEPISPRKVNTSVPRDLETICLKCLEKESHKRYGTAQLLADDLRLFLAGKPVKARPVSSIERGWRWCRRNSALAALSGVMLLVVLCAPIVVWHQVTTIVNGVQDARGAAIPNLISHLHKYPPFLVAPIVKSRFENEPDSHRKLSLAFALAALGTINAEYLASQAESVSEEDTGNLIAALSADRDASLDILRTEAAATASEKDWRRKSQLAILALHLGDSELAADMCRIEDRPDPVQRTFFIDESPRWYGDTTALARFVRSSSDPGLRSALLLGAGRISGNRLSPEKKQVWQGVAEELYVTQLDTSTHSAAGWLLRQWKVGLPEIPADTGLVAHNNFYVNSQGQTFLKIPAGSFHQLAESNEERQDRDVFISESFWLSDREVSAGQFQRFVVDSKFPHAENPAGWPLTIHKGPGWPAAAKYPSSTPHHPVTHVSWYDAILYCNWLSVKEGLSPAYERTGVRERSGESEFDAWRLIEGTNGYHLPLEIEWEYACRAGTTTEWASGNDEELLRSYAHCSASEIEPCGVKFPNAWGLWDMHGNVYELCNERNVPTHNSRVCRGGSFLYHLSYFRAAIRHHVEPRRRYNDLGFRVARTVQPAPSARLLPADGVATPESPNSIPQPPVGPVLLKSRPLVGSGVRFTSVAHFSDNSRVLFGGFDGLTRLFNLDTEKEFTTLRGHEDVVWSVALSPDGLTAVTGSQDKTLRLWDVASGKELDRFTAGGIFSCVRVSKDGKSIYATNWDTKVRVWKRSGNRLNKPSEFPFAFSTLDIAVLPDETQFVIGTAEKQVLLCDAVNGQILKTFDGHSGWVHSVAVVNAGEKILSASHDSTLRLWDIETAKAERVYLGHKGVVNEVRVLPDGRHFLSCGADRTVRLWDIDSGRELARGIGSGDLRGLSVAPDGKSCVTAGLDGSLWDWELPGSTELGLISSAGFVPEMLTGDAFQQDYDVKRKLLLQITDIFIRVDPLTNNRLYAIDWGPADGKAFIVHHGMSDSTLEQNEAQAVLQGYKRAEVKTVTINGVNHHIGLWTK